GFPQAGRLYRTAPTDAVLGTARPATCELRPAAFPNPVYSPYCMCDDAKMWSRRTIVGDAQRASRRESCVQPVTACVTMQIGRQVQATAALWDSHKRAAFTGRPLRMRSLGPRRPAACELRTAACVL
ncbi:hypothetical protein, partial [uncultured Megasphaera sp.]|uniref:hypothetical protein n=1 Tax=uncultured Megasphaera sp. TaxID=165188 RepID=UPI0025D718DC